MKWFWSLCLVALSCESQSAGTPPPAQAKKSPRQHAQEVAAAIAAGDARPVGALVAKTGAEVRVEIKQALVETDERTSETLRSAADLEAWVSRTKPKWGCSGAGCLWPKGFVTGDLARCMGDCCFSDHAGGIEKDTLYLRRVCLAAREAGEHRLSYIGFVEAK